MVEKSRTKDIVFTTIIIILIVLAVKGLAIIGQFMGFVTYHAADAGTITEIDIKISFDVSHWSAIYGTAWGVGWTQEWYYNFTGNVSLSEAANEKHLLFECMEPGIDHEIYASMVPEADITFSSLVAATTAEYDAYLNVGASEFYSASNTFTESYNFNVGDLQISAPATYTYVWNSTGSTSFVTGILKDDSGNLILVTKVIGTPIQSFKSERFNYQMLLPIANTSWQDYYFWTDPTDECPEGNGTAPFTGTLIGNVTDSAGNPIEQAVIQVGSYATYSQTTTGFYNMSVAEGNFKIFAMKTGYDIYQSNVTIVRGNTTVHNIVMIAEQPPYPPLTGIGPGEDDPGTSTEAGVDEAGTETKTGDYDMPPVIQKPQKIEGTDYIISISEINRKLRLGNFLQEKITLYSFKERPASIYFEITGNISDLIKIDKESMVLQPRSDDYVTLTAFGVGTPGVYNGSLDMTGDINATIPITIEILQKDMLPVQALLIDLELNKKIVFPGERLKFQTNMRNLLTDLEYPVNLLYTIQDAEGQETVWSYDTNVFMKTSFSLLKNALIGPKAKPGDYVLRVTASYLGLTAGTSVMFRISTPWYLVTVVGPFKVWHIILFLILAGLGVFAYFHIKKRIEDKKKFHLKVEMNELPKPGPRSIFVGKIAETDNKTYFNMEAFMTHTIDAGSTGSGKSVSAQVIVEELLDKGVAVIVFDPTAQWTGMLRKCTDKTMLALYPYFGMKPTDAKPFSGNIRQINNPREQIDIKKYVKPGEIQVFACHKLEPKEMDIFVSNSIRQIFRANFQESRTLKVLFVYDEVHRLLPKFGGSGEGFLQIERGCREFRKWGLGMLLISQVLSDFVGTIKANINTEVQMRTRDEGDLERIRVKYGEDVLRSLVKATVGSGMVENPHYNRGKPYFIAFKPLKHSVQRLTDEEIEKYNEFNDQIDQLQFELQQLEQEKIDIFDLKLELKLASDKVKTGNFNMVQIYTEGIVPRIKKHWEKLGKQAKKLEIKIVSEEELQEALNAAKKARADYETEKKKQDAKKAKAEAEEGKEGEEKKENLFKKDVNPDKILKLVNGMLVINMASLYDEIAAMKDEDFEKHVTIDKNDFADWIRDAVGDKELAEHISFTRDKDKMLKLLDLRRENKPLPKLDKEAAKKMQEEEILEELSKPPEEQKKQPQKEVKKEVKPEIKPAEPVIKKEEQKTEKPTEDLEKKISLEQIKKAIKASIQIHEPEPEVTQVVHTFKLQNGEEIRNLDELKQKLKQMDDNTFQNYVGEDYNHFANWIRDELQKPQLADKIYHIRDKNKLVEVLENG
ncbi:MAG: DUF87 domain-containing protein [Nanoarchaeota archaeon]|nr:DUF87 domain-containing protein [Nanoarchaeota archaeon]MBU1321275.1 DUF87 domain-containing protein [Nanoarchaeota archaeon]MBU1597105.1 DUF87 domain-containing protein [Nanoarchaeota archaeon]MBU2442152.1 DUF87 domain-containing protein [Nanoarchaeota archaeon]